MSGWTDRASLYDPREHVLTMLADGPKSSRELGVLTPLLKGMAEDGIVSIDPDHFPDEYVAGNPFIARLPGDDRPWPGWEKWNL